MGKAFSQTNTEALFQSTAAAIDVDEWARYFALQTLMGIVDIYGTDNPHNIAFYQRSNDGRIVVLQNDWGYPFQTSTSASIYGKNNLFTILKLPVYNRLYQGHLLDLMNHVYNSAYLSRWAQHFTSVTGSSFDDAPSYADSRDASVRSQLAAQIPFAITSNGGKDFTVNTPSVTLEGQAWIDVHDIGLAGENNHLSVTWLDDQRWQIVVPLKANTNAINLVAYDCRGEQVALGNINVTTTVSGFPQRDYLRITELMYDPHPVTAAELAAGFSDNEDFEFIELMNTGPTNLSLLGVKFTAGVAFDFTTSTITNLAANQRVLVVSKKSAFAFRYGAGLPIAGSYSGHLDNSGELVRLVDSFGIVIQEFTYGNSGTWPVVARGQGRSLEVLNVNGDYSNPLNWQASLLDDGSPGNPATIRPAFAAVTQEGGRVHFRLQAAAHQAYTLRYADNMDNGPWQVLTTIPAGATTRSEDLIDTLPGTTQRFYRLTTP